MLQRQQGFNNVRVMGLGGRIYSGGINCAVSAQEGVRNRPYKGMELLRKPVSAELK